MPVYAWIGVIAIALLVLTGSGLALRAYLYRLVDRRIASFQSDLVTKHCDEVLNIYREMRGWRHDYHNHIQTMKAYRYLEQNDRLDDYLISLDQDLTDVDNLIKSGNVMVDAILNSKLSLAKSRRININAKAVVPGELSLSETDLCVIIGNLLDNAMEACARIENETERFIRIYIDIKRDQLYISVTNTSGGQIKKQSGRYLSSKPGYHGFGLMRIDRLIEKYGGYVKRRDEESAFTTEILLPLK
ncbi:MAG: GHKL domain-containing protein [Clostridiales bacterium]|jgi:sensor histidine kinase regulating citrate/malate metabolism|nr:GHKL domain-containing protein [Clostridiales bacterium]